MGAIDRDRLRDKIRDLDVEMSEDVEPELRLIAQASEALVLLGRLRDDPGISMRRLVDLTAIDRGEGPARFEIVYRLHSPGSNTHMRVHVRVVEEECIVDSAISLWPAADWLEREVFDLFGIRFRGHPDLRRILLEADFEGAPLRKDYPRQPDLSLPKEAER